MSSRSRSHFGIVNLFGWRTVQTIPRIWSLMMSLNCRSGCIFFTSFFLYYTPFISLLQPFCAMVFGGVRRKFSAWFFCGILSNVLPRLRLAAASCAPLQDGLPFYPLLCGGQTAAAVRSEAKSIRQNSTYVTSHGGEFP
jgi:hypothetical protein